MELNKTSDPTGVVQRVLMSPGTIPSHLSLGMPAPANLPHQILWTGTATTPKAAGWAEEQSYGGTSHPFPK